MQKHLYAAVVEYLLHSNTSLTFAHSEGVYMQAIAMNGLSTFDLKQRASNFEQHAKVTAEKERRKAEKERIQQERAAARRAAHEAAVAEVRQKQLEAAEQVPITLQQHRYHKQHIFFDLGDVSGLLWRHVVVCRCSPAVCSSDQTRVSFHPFNSQTHTYYERRMLGVCLYALLSEQTARSSLALLLVCTQAEQQRQEDLEHNKGVSITATLTAAPLSTAVAAAKGVKRHEDKVILPASLSSELMKQRAFEHGQLFWRISARDGRSTVASALEFTAPEGVIMLPPKVTKGLWGLDVRFK